MGLFSKSHVFHRSVRRDHARREEEIKKSYEPKKIQLPTILDDLERTRIAQENLKAQGIMPPVDPHPSQRMQCAPNPQKILNAIADGIDMGGIQNADTMVTLPTMEEATNTGFFTIFNVTKQFIKDSINIQNCMNKQDQKYKAELAQYHKYLKEEKKKVPEVEMREKVVTHNEPGHPKYKNPQNSAPKQQNPVGFTFYTNGQTTGGRMIFKF